MIIFADNGRLSTSLATNRNNFYNSSKSKTNNEKTSQSENSNQDIEITKPNNISSIYFDVVDESYAILSGILTQPEGNGYDSNYLAGKAIKVRGFVLKKNVPYLPSGYFAIGKYVITCCATDAGYGGFYAKHDLGKIDENKGRFKINKDKIKLSKKQKVNNEE